jgi:microcystin degradation protein MlrC
MRVGIIALLQESNTFIARHTTLDDFRADLLAIGGQVRERLATAHHEAGGFFEGLERAGAEAVPIFAARALPYGVMTASTRERLCRDMLDGLARAGGLDGVLVAAHGATVAEDCADFDGDWLTRVRRLVGAGVPVIGTIDPHANLSQAMVEATDALIAYRTNPHVDQRQRGLEAAGIMIRTLSGEIAPTQAAVFPPMAINIERQATSEPPCRLLEERAAAMRARGGVLAVSLVLGFPYADVSEMGASALVVTDRDPWLAERLAGELGLAMWSRRADLAGHLIGVDEALDRAGALPPPVCLLDMGDNVGGGSPGDSTFMAAALHARREGPAFVCLYDPGAVADVQAAGPGRRVRLRIGGKTDDRHGAPLEAEFTVIGLHDGRFDEPDPRHGGLTSFDQGRTAIVSTDCGLTVMLTSRRAVPWSLRQLTSCGLEPASFRFLVAKGVHAPVAAYQAVCRSFVRVDTPGVTSADLSRLDYRRRRRPMVPFEQDVEWAPTSGVPDLHD